MFVKTNEKFESDEICPYINTFICHHLEDFNNNKHT